MSPRKSGCIMHTCVYGIVL